MLILITTKIILYIKYIKYYIHKKTKFYFNSPRNMLILLSLIYIVNWVNTPRIPRIPVGFTAFGAGSVATSIYLAKKESDTAKKVAEDSKENCNKIIDNSIDNCNKLINNFSIPSITEAFQKSVAFFSQFDLLTQCLIFNIITSVSLLNLLYIFLLSKYGNYLIEKFNLEAKYPKLNKFFKARLFFQNYYYKYLTVLAILFLLNSIFINLYALLG
uniref:hypothetical protein n=1 Tax=Trametes meyenii TaxID=526243 RepID=UPI0030022D21|nr:hypothetical protein [Trametes meyenii]